jgi:DNA-3-methyladenine glycosylase I
MTPVRIAKGLLVGDDGVVRCWWAGSDPLYLRYHDREWGRPVRSEVRLFEKLCLEGFQAGLAWITILRKREAFRAAFARFDPEVVSAFGPRDVARLLRDAGIVRHRGKIESTINNAHRAIELRAEGGLPAYAWGFEPGTGDRPKRLTQDRLMTMATTPASIAMSRDLRARGWTFVGPTTLYAFMQAMGLVNDHLEGCDVRAACDADRAAFKRPRTPSRGRGIARDVSQLIEGHARDR